MVRLLRCGDCIETFGFSILIDLTAIVEDVKLHIAQKAKAAKGQSKQGGRGLFRGKRKGKIPFANPKLHIISIITFLLLEKSKNSKNISRL